MSTNHNLLKVIEKTKPLIEGGKFNVALRRLRDVVKKYPNESYLLAYIAFVSQRAGKDRLAADYYLQALKFDSHNASYLFNYGVLLYGMRKFTKGLKYVESALNYEKNSFYFLTYAKFLYNSGYTKKAEKYLNLAEKLDTSKNEIRTEISWNKSHVYLRQGKLDLGWKYFESRLNFRNAERTHEPMKSMKILKGEIPEWRGENLNNKTIIINDEQGFGDTIQFSRYILALGEKYKNINVNFICKKELYRLFDFMPEFIKVYYREGNNDVIEKITGDFHAFLMSIPIYFEKNYESIYSKYPYITSEGIEKDYPFIVKDKFNVGISWTGSNINPNDANRSINSLELLEPILSIKNINFISFQIGNSHVALEESINMKEISNYVEDFKDSLNIIKKLDLIITIDTALAHLAGAANIPCWVLLPKIATDWRWGENLKQCPWYKSLKIYKQESPDDWSVPINLVAREIRQNFKI